MRIIPDRPISENERRKIQDPYTSDTWDDNLEGEVMTTAYETVKMLKSETEEERRQRIRRGAEALTSLKSCSVGQAIRDIERVSKSTTLLEISEECVDL